MFIIITIFLIAIYFGYRLSNKKFTSLLVSNNGNNVANYGKAKYFSIYLVIALLVAFVIVFITYKFLLSYYLQQYVLTSNNVHPRALLLLKQQAKQLAETTGFFGSYNITFNTLLPANLLIKIAKLYNFTLLISYVLFAIVLTIVVGVVYGYLIKKANININYVNKVESITKKVLFALTSIAVVTTVAIVISLLLETLDFFKYVPVSKFLFGTVWDPSQADINATNNFGVIPLITGTLLIAVIATVFSTIIGVMGAVYMAEYMPKSARKFVKPALEILAGIPSIVYGFFAAVYFAPVIVGFLKYFGVQASYENALNAGIIIGVMIIPFISSISDDALRSVPKPIKEGALAMGSLKHEMILKVCLPASLSGILGGVILAFSRAIGETMVVVMAASLSANLTFNPTQPVTTITTQIAMLLQGDQEFNSPKTLSTFALGLVLLLLTLILNVIIFKITKKYKNKY